MEMNGWWLISFFCFESNLWKEFSETISFVARGKRVIRWILDWIRLKGKGKIRIDYFMNEKL